MNDREVCEFGAADDGGCSALASLAGRWGLSQVMASVVPRDLPRSTLFRHTTGCCGALLEYAFERAERRLFWPFSSVPEAEGRTRNGCRYRCLICVPRPGRRARATPPGRQRCGAVTSTTRLTVEVGNNERRPQLGVDESCVLEVSSEGGVLRAQANEALHGLEAFTSLVQWDGERLLICEVPIRIDDSPETAGTASLGHLRHYLSVDEVLLPLLMAWQQ